VPRHPIGNYINVCLICYKVLTLIWQKVKGKSASHDLCRRGRSLIKGLREHLGGRERKREMKIVKERLRQRKKSSEDPTQKMDLTTQRFNKWEYGRNIIFIHRHPFIITKLNDKLYVQYTLYALFITINPHNINQRQKARESIWTKQTWKTLINVVE